MTDFKWRAEHITNKEYERHSMMMMINVQRVSRVCGWFQECFNLSYWVCYNSYSRPYTIYYIQNHIRWDAMRHSRRCQANFHHKYHVIEHSLWDQIPSKLSFPNYDWVKIEIFGCGWIESNKLLKSDTHTVTEMGIRFQKELVFIKLNPSEPILFTWESTSRRIHSQTLNWHCQWGITMLKAIGLCES